MHSQWSTGAAVKDKASFSFRQEERMDEMDRFESYISSSFPAFCLWPSVPAKDVFLHVAGSAGIKIGWK